MNSDKFREPCTKGKFTFWNMAKGSQKDIESQVEEIIMKMELEKEKKVDSFEEIGCFNPFDTDKSLEKAECYINKLNIKSEVYKGFMTKAVL